MTKRTQRRAKKARNKAYDPHEYLRRARNIESRIAERRAVHEREQLMAHGMELSQIQDIGLAFHLAFRALRDSAGAGNECDVDAVACALNIGLVLCEFGIGKEYESAMVGALDGVFRAKVRGKKIGRWGLDGDAIRAIEFALAIHEAQLGAAKKGEVVKAIGEVHRRLEAGDVYRDAA